MGKFIVYQILPRVFANTNRNCKSGGSLALNGTGKLNSISCEVLERLKRLSITHIWYTGVIEHATKSSFSEVGISGDNPQIVKGEAGSPYAIKDYYDIAPYLAENTGNRMAEFEALVERTHRAGLKVIVDFVPNHLSRVYHSDSPERSGEDFGISDNPSVAFSPMNNFYYLPGSKLDLCGTGAAGSLENQYTEIPARATGNDCFSPTPHNSDWYETVKLNYGVDYLGGGAGHFSPHPKTWKMMLDVLLFWCGKGVDGFRCDMAEMVPVEFWNFAIGEVRRRYRDIVFIAEIYDRAKYNDYIAKGGFNYLYDKVGMYDTLKAITRSQNPDIESDTDVPAWEITSCWQGIDKIQPNMLNFLENHDEQRIASDFNLGSPFYAVPELAVSLLFNTAPFMLYFGQETGERGMESEGFSGLDGRTSIFDYCSAPSVVDYFEYLSGRKEFTELGKRERELYEIYRKLLAISMEEDAVKEGHTFDLEYANRSDQGFDARKEFVFARRSRHSLTSGGESLIIVAADFSQRAENINVFIPKYFLDCWEIGERSLLFKDLLNDKREQKIALFYDMPISLQLNRYGIAVIKALL